MNTPQPSRPVITPAMREQATKQPNTWLYVVDPIFTDPDAEIPPWGFIGGYRVDERGELTDDFSPNPNYRPSPVALRLPAPTNDVERALQLSTTGYAQGQTLLTALLDAELILFAQPQGAGLFTLEHESGRRQLQLFTSDSFLPPNWTSWQRMTGRQLASKNPVGIDLQINPTSPVKARIPAEDLIKAAGSIPPKIPSGPMPAPVVNGTPASQSGPNPMQSGPNPMQSGPNQVHSGPHQALPPAQVRPNPAPPAAPAVAPKPEPGPDLAETDYGRRFLGSLLAGAIGDALGAAIEFYPIDQIRSRYGAQGVADYDRSSDRAGEFTDDTQMTLFTLEGLIRGHILVRAGKATGPLATVQLAYQRWLHTQGYAWSRAAGPFGERHPSPNGWLIEQRELFAVRSPNSDCITALREFASSSKPGTFEHALNESQASGGVVRVAPVALWSEAPKAVFELAAAIAALTYSKPSGYLPAGVLAVLVQRLLRGESLPEALNLARSLLTTYAGHEETDRLLQAARDLAALGKPTPEEVKDRLGSGWTGPEALAIAVCAALSTDGVAAAMMIAINHSGDSDSTGAICGNLVGAMYGSGSLPGVWLRDLKHRELVETLAKDALAEFSPKSPETRTWAERYPADDDIIDLKFSSVLPAVGAEPRQSAKPETSESSGDETERDTVVRPLPRLDQQQGTAKQRGGAPASRPSGEPAQPSVPSDKTAAPSDQAAAAKTTGAQSGPAPEQDGDPGEDQPASRAGTAAVAGAAAATASAASAGTAKTADSDQSAKPAETRAPAAAEKAEKQAESAGPTYDRAARITGLLLGSAIGDALGYPVEDASLETIRERYGKAGVTDFVDAHRPAGSISNGTQMMLFTVDGMIRAAIRRRVHGEDDPIPRIQHAYQRWLHTQGFDWKDAGGPLAANPPDGWLIHQKGLFARRAPGATCIQALHGYASGKPLGTLENRLNASKGCGGVMRAAALGLWSQDPAEVFRQGAASALLTHGHTSGFLPAGALAVITQQLVAGRTIPEAIEQALVELPSWEGHEETGAAIRRAIELAAEHEDPAEVDPAKVNERLGQGWSGEEALSIALHAALTHPKSFSSAVVLAANHSGASDVTAAICGSILGAAHTTAEIPRRWLDKLELREITEELAQDAAREFGTNPPECEQWLLRYPIEVPAAPAGEAAEAESEAAQPENATPQQAEDAESPGKPEETGKTGAPEAATAEARAEAPAEAAPQSPAAEPATSESAPQAQEDEGEDLSDEEFQLLAAWRKFRDGDDEAPADLSQGLHKLLVEAFGEERAAQLIGETLEAGGETGATEDEGQPAEETAIQVNRAERFSGCVLGTAVGDALAAPWLFADVRSILRSNPDGVREYTECFGTRGAATALSQQAVFVLDGLVRSAIQARLRGSATNPASTVHHALQHWLCTQGTCFEPAIPLGALAETPALRAQRFPDEATMTALAMWDAAEDIPTTINPPNAARTTAAAVRGAAIGLYTDTPASAVSLGCEIAVLTHGHPDGYLPAGALAGMASALQQGQTIAESATTVLGELDLVEGSERTTHGLRKALELAAHGPVSPRDLSALGSGWDAPEALAIAVAAALSHPNDFADAVALAATHSGNSAATAAMCGALLGTARGVRAIPSEWSEELELREVFDRLLTDENRIAADVRADQPAPDWAKRYLE